MNKEKSPKLNTKPSSNNPFDEWFKKLPTTKKSTKDYGKVTVDALKRIKDSPSETKLKTKDKEIEDLKKKLKEKDRETKALLKQVKEALDEEE